MRRRNIVFHAAVVLALGTMCMAQGMGQGQQGMGQRGQGIGQNGTMPNTMSTDSTTPDMGMANPDQMFMRKAAQGGMAEVALGNLAEQNAGNDAVKQFGNRMVTDHSQANNELKQIAQKEGVTLPSDVSSKDKKLSKMLQAKQGSDFDKAYVHDMVKDHETDIAEFRNEAKNGQDPQVKAWAQKTLPVLEQHLAQAKQVAAQVGVDSGKKTAGAMSAQQ